MSGDVGKVQGPVGPVESKKDSSPADAEKFQAALREQTSKVSAVDPDEERRRKRNQEAEEESRASAELARTQVPQEPKEPAPFQVTQQPHHVSRIGMRARSEQITANAAPSPTELYTETWGEEAPSTFPSTSNSSTSSNPSLPAQSPEETPSTPTQEASSSTPQQKNSTHPAKEAETKKEHPPSKIDAELLLKQAKVEEAKTHKAHAQIAEVSLQGGGVAPLPALVSGVKPDETSVPKKAPIEGLIQTVPLVPEIPKETLGFEPLENLQPNNPYAKLHPEVQALFERIVGVISVMQQSGIKETSFTLNMPKFASSVFFGSRIIIREFSTAAKAFNIEFSGSEAAVSLFQANASDLAAAFQAGNYAFRVHRMETSYLTERPLFKRKEGGQDSQQQQSGDSHG